MQPWHLPTGFVAYPSTPPTLAETIRDSVQTINESKQVFLKTWQSTNVGGKWVIAEILKAIDESKVFVADVTGLNLNVLFELGYAIGKNKPVWLLLDKTRGDAQWKTLRLLTTIGHCFYENDQEIVASYFEDAPHLQTESSLHAEMIAPHLNVKSGDAILYLKSQYDTNTAGKLTTRIQKSSLKVIVDDPQESPYQNLSWYAKQVSQAVAVVCHFSDPTREGVELRNARASLVAGLAVGLGKQLLILSESDFLAPLDYRDYLFHYTTARAALRHLNSWLTQQEEGLGGRQRFKDYRHSQKLAAELKTLDLGEHIAENEADGLVHGYFVETKAYLDAVDGKQLVFVGRKGAGKSANFLQLATVLSNDRRNYVAIIKPVAYDLGGLLHVLSDLKERAVQGFAVEALWKFLLYSEISQVCVDRIQEVDAAARTSEQEHLLEWVERHRELFDGDFSERLERCIKYLTAKPDGTGGTLTSVRESIAEKLHTDVLGELRKLLVKSLPKKARMAFLLDNLDKAWGDATDFDTSSEFLLGLLTASNRLRRELQREASQHDLDLDITLTLFLRADIFERVSRVAREPDKIVHQWLLWDDVTLLARLIEERYLSTAKGPPDELWGRYFCRDVHGRSTREYLLSQVIPRPRDLIYLVNCAISVAVNRGHSTIEAADIFEAQKQYSEFVVDVLRIENSINGIDMENVLLEFMGCGITLEEHEVFRHLENAEVPAGRRPEVVDFLCQFSFLGLVVGENEFRFPERRRDLVKFRKLASLRSANKQPRYTVHPAFHPFLEISESNTELMRGTQ